MTGKKVASGSSIGLAGVLTIIFVVAKIGGHIDWNWMWVFAPLWLPVAVVVGLWLAALAIFGTVILVRTMITMALVWVESKISN